MATSDHALPSGIAARPLFESDLNSALALSQEAGWNQVAADWRIFLELGSVTCLTRGDGPPIATAATLPYDGSFAWISTVLVTAAERRQGLARWLMRHCIEELLARKLVPVLDATPAGRTVYVGLGFNDCWPMHRLVGRTVRTPPAMSNAVAVRALTAHDWPQVIAYDTAVFGAERSALLRRLADRLPNAALVAERGGRIAGFLLGRDGRVMSSARPLGGRRRCRCKRASGAGHHRHTGTADRRRSRSPRRPPRLAGHARLYRGAAVDPYGLWNARGF